MVAALCRWLWRLERRAWKNRSFAVRRVGRWLGCIGVDLSDSGQRAMSGQWHMGGRRV